MISENEIGFLVLHIGVGLERHYNIGYQRQPRVLLVCDAGNAMVRMIEAVLQRKYPQIEVTRTLTLREYELADAIGEDFVISTARVSEKSKPVVMIAPFPTDYQLEQIGKLVLVDRTRPWMLEKYFDAAHFRIIDKPVDQQTLFRELCEQLEAEGFVGAEFLDSVIEREAIVSTMLGDGIALPHSLGLLAQAVVYTVLAPQGIQWEMKPPMSSSCSPSAKASTKRQWRFTTSLSLSCVNARWRACASARILRRLRLWRWRV